MVLFEVNPADAWEAFLSFAVEPGGERIFEAAVLRSRPSMVGIEIANDGA